MPLVIGLVFLGLWIAACLWYPLTDTDIWWHLAAAEWMVANRGFPRVDPFCASSLGKPWIDLHWGFQILAHALWMVGGAAALVGGKVLAVGISVHLALAPHLRRGNAAILLTLAAFGIYHVRFFLDMRPLVVTMAGLSLLYLGATSHLDGRLRRPWRVLLPIQVALANMQGLYPLGALLVTCLLAGAWWERERGGDLARGGGGRGGEGPPSLKPLAFTCAGLWLAGLCTPYGWQGFLLPLALLARITPLPGNVFSAEIAENQPLHALAMRDPLAVAPYVILLLVVLWTFARAASRRRFSPGHALLFGGFALLGAMAQRNLPLAFLACLMAAGHNLRVSLDVGGAGAAGAIGQGGEESGWTGRIGPIGRWMAHPWAAVLGIAAIAAWYVPRIRQAWAYELPGSLETPFRFPARAADYLASHPLEGALFNELRFGGYLAFRLYPDKLPWVDGRMILRDAEFYREFLAVVDRPERFQAYARARGMTHALLPIGEDGRFLPLAARLLGPDGWSLLYCDGAAALLAEPSVAGPLALPVDGIHPGHPVWTALKERFQSNPRLVAIATRNLGLFLSLAGKGDAARRLPGTGPEAGESGEGGQGGQGPPRP